MKYFIIIIMLLLPRIAQAQNSFVLDDKIIIELPSGYGPILEGYAVAESDLSFSAPIDNSEIAEHLSLLGIDMTANEYFDDFVEAMYSDGDDLPKEVLRNNFKNLHFQIVNIVPDERFSTDMLPNRLPESEIATMEEFCDSFFSGFTDRWGSWTFKNYNEIDEICHVANLTGAVISVSVRRVDNYYLHVASLDFPLAMMGDMAESEVESSFDFESSTLEEKLKLFGPGLNLNHAHQALLSARSKSTTNKE